MVKQNQGQLPAAPSLSPRRVLYAPGRPRKSHAKVGNSALCLVTFFTWLPRENEWRRSMRVFRSIPPNCCAVDTLF